MKKKWWRFFITIPAAAIIYVPLLLVWLEFHNLPIVNFSWLKYALAFVVLWAGVVLVMWAYIVLIRDGGTTIELQIPTTKLVKNGPYHYIRNPMAVGIALILIGEALYFSSLYILIWSLIVIEVMVYYITHVEEYKLANRFGQEYINYKMDVGKWFPKIRR